MVAGYASMLTLGNMILGSHWNTVYIKKMFGINLI